MRLRCHWSLIQYTFIKIQEKETLFTKAKDFFIIATSGLSFIILIYFVKIKNFLLKVLQIKVTEIV